MQRDIADPPDSTTEVQTDAVAPGAEPPDGEQPAPGGRRRSRWALALEGLVVYVVLQVLTYPFLPAVRDRGQAFYNDVLVGFFGPEKHGLARILRSGILPAWVNDQYGGEPFIANLQHAVFYPGNLPFWLLKTSLAIDVVCAFHVAFAGLAMWAFCRFALRTSRWGASLAGLAFGFGSVTLQHIILMNQLEVIAWMPVVLLFSHLALERRRLRYVLLTGVAVGMQLLAGHPEEWVYTLLTLAVYGAGWVLVSNPRQWPRRALGAALSLGGALVAFTLLFAWQLLPTLLLQRNGYRTDPTFSQQFPLPKAIAFNALLPDFGHVLIGENVAFIGVVALALAGLGIAAGPRRLLWARSALLVLAVLGVIMALGNQNGFYRFVYQHVHLVQQFRVPGRYLLLTYFATAAAAGLGMDALLYGRVGQLVRRAVAAVGGLAVLSVLLGTALLFGGVSYYVPSRRWWILVAVVGGVGWALANFRVVPRVVIALLLIGVTAVELRQARPGAEYHEMVPDVVYDDPGPIMDRLGQDGGRYVTIAWDLPGNPQQRASIVIPPGLSPTEAAYYGVRWFVTPVPMSGTETDVLRQHGFAPVDKQAFFQLWERPALPMARMAYQADVVPSETDRLARLRAGYPLLDRVMVGQPVGSLQRPATNPVVNVLDRDYSKVEVSVRTQTDGVLVLPDPYYPQWHVKVDGKPAKLLEVDHAFRGVKVPAGAHQVVFAYQDRAMQAGFLLSLLTCLGILGLWVWSRRRAPRAVEADDDGPGGDAPGPNGPGRPGGPGRPAGDGSSGDGSADHGSSGDGSAASTPREMQLRSAK